MPSSGENWRSTKLQFRMVESIIAEKEMLARSIFKPSARARSLRLAVLFVVIDQAVRRGVVRRDRPGLREFGQDRFGELLAKLDAPLIERVDVPDDPLRENFVLVERD